MMVPSRALLEDIMGFISTTQAGAGESLLFAGLIGLIKDPIAPDIDTLLADLTEANFTGYARTAGVTWTAVFDDLSGLVVVRSGITHYQPSDAVTPNTIHGAFLVDAGGTILLATEAFDNSIPMPDADAGFDYTATFGLDPGANYGLGLVG